jgi:type VI secretion system secreted protein VgrG
MRVFAATSVILLALGANAALALPAALSSAAAPSLGSAAAFAVLGGSTVTNLGATTLSGSLGLDPGISVTGFPPGMLTSGAIHVDDVLAQTAQTDLAQALGALAGESCGQDLSGLDLGGLTLTPGVYCFDAAAQLTGTLTLDGQGDSGAVFVFQVGSTLTTAVGATVALIGGVQPCNVFWRVGSSATLGGSTTWVGNLLAAVSITVGNSANLSGRALAQSGAVTLDLNQVSAVTCAAVPPCQGAANGTPCDDDDGCTQTDTCQSNACVGANPVVCASGGACAMPGTCAPATGLCTFPLPPCATSGGDPHILTFDGVFFDLMAVGDFLLVHTPNVNIQVRQSRPVAGLAVAINTGAVVQLGSDRIAFCSQPRQVWINGVAGSCTTAPTRLAGGSLCTRHGNVFALHSDHGDVAVLLGNPGINVTVSLPPTVTDITGLLGTRDGEPRNDVTPRNGDALPLTTSFAAFYDQFVSSWVVPPADSLFGADAASTESVSTPYEPPLAAFDIADLPLGLRVAATAVCVAAGVADAVLLDACTLDVAASGESAAADVFTKMAPPRAVVLLTGARAVLPSTPDAQAAPITAAAGCAAGRAQAGGADLLAACVVALLLWRRWARSGTQLARARSGCTR